MKMVSKLLQTPHAIPRISCATILHTIDVDIKTLSTRPNCLHVRRQIGQIAATHVLEESSEPLRDTF